MNQLLLAFFPLMMAFAASSDLLTMRISNKLSAGLAFGFAIAALIMAMPLNVFALHLGMGLVVLAVGFTFFAMGWIGGGDAKFAAATVLWLGLPQIMPFLVYSALLGGGLTLALLAARRLPLPQPLASVGWIDRLHDTRTGVPYGIALAAAGLMVYSQTEVFAFFVG